MVVLSINFSFPAFILLTGHYDYLTIQHWCAMTIEAIFNINNDVEHLFYSHLWTSITELENTLKQPYFLPPHRRTRMCPVIAARKEGP